MQRLGWNEAQSFMLRLHFSLTVYVHILDHRPSGCHLQIIPAKRSSVHQKDTSYTPQEKTFFSFHCFLHLNIMVQFLRNNITLLSHAIKNVKKRTLIFLIEFWIPDSSQEHLSDEAAADISKESILRACSRMRAANQRHKSPNRKSI